MKKGLSIFLVTLMLLTLTIPAMAVAPEPAPAPMRAIDLVNEYVMAMSVQELTIIGERTDMVATFSSADGHVWTEPIYKIDTTDAFRAFSTDASIDEYSHTFFVPLSSRAMSGTYFSRVTAVLTINFTQAANHYARLTSVSGRLDWQESGSQFSWGSVNYITLCPRLAPNQNRTRTVTGPFSFNTGFTTSVLPTTSAAFGVVAAHWNFSYRMGTGAWVNARITVRVPGPA